MNLEKEVKRNHIEDLKVKIREVTERYIRAFISVETAPAIKGDRSDFYVAKEDLNKVRQELVDIAITELQASSDKAEVLSVILEAINEESQARDSSYDYNKMVLMKLLPAIILRLLN